MAILCCSTWTTHQRAPASYPISDTFTWTPTSAQGPASYTFFVNASDPYGAFDEQPVTVTVVDPNGSSDLPGDSLSTALPVNLSNGTTAMLAPEMIGDGLYGARDVDLYSVALSTGRF